MSNFRTTFEVQNLPLIRRLAKDRMPEKDLRKPDWFFSAEEFFNARPNDTVESYVRRSCQSVLGVVGSMGVSQIEFMSLPDGVQGYYDRLNNRIVINPQVPENFQSKLCAYLLGVASHEMGHSRLSTAQPLECFWWQRAEDTVANWQARQANRFLGTANQELMENSFCTPEQILSPELSLQIELALMCPYASVANEVLSDDDWEKFEFVFSSEVPLRTKDSGYANVLADVILQVLPKDAKKLPSGPCQRSESLSECTEATESGDSSKDEQDSPTEKSKSSKDSKSNPASDQSKKPKPETSKKPSELYPGKQWESILLGDIEVNENESNIRKGGFYDAGDTVSYTERPYVKHEVPDKLELYKSRLAIRARGVDNALPMARLVTGKFDKRAMSRLGYSNTVFCRNIEGNIAYADPAIAILIDGSGSMQGEKIQNASHVGYLVGYAASQMSKGWWGVFSHTAKDNTEITKWAGKDFCEPDNVLALPQLRAYNNFDYDAIDFCAGILNEQREKTKILIVISDGLPCGRLGVVYPVKQTREAVENAESSGVHVMGVNIDAGENLYSEYYDMKHTENFVDEFFPILERQFTRV